MYGQKIIGKLQRDLDAFDSMMKKRMQLMKDELDELSLVSNKELMSELKKIRRRFQKWRGYSLQQQGRNGKTLLNRFEWCANVPC
ncbi:hypothetical protein L6303_05840 [archaeon]|nr:hypothetical protein [Nanoarchaeota archaeon]MBU4300436.1 hypothetical protein [Nanoarchaeota archaeon]MBU4451247.1 hypothetical protein [Nanoarchaeota archaeon]MCG2724240.1 hypothetical protein [archaeon]